jgi:pimeloyl-ACP methyl ester carboxylesterase
MRASSPLCSIVYLCCLWICVGAAAAERFPNLTRAIVDIDTRDHASYRIDIPANWNHRLIVFYHGYALEPIVFRADEAISPMFQPMFDEGYAVLQSGYSAGGWAVEQAYADTEKLRGYFNAKYGFPRQSVVMGMSMGGTLTAMTIEQRPEVYDAAFSLCGALEPSDRLMQRDLALRAAFDFYFPGVLGDLVSAAAPKPFDERNIAAALISKPPATQALLRWYGAADSNNLAPVIAFTGYEIADLQKRAHGMPVGNADLIYVGSGDDAAINAGVRRYRADARAAQYLARWYTPTGKLTRPFLALHDAGDPLVPANSANEYALAAARAGHGDNFVQQYVDREGHCAFTPQEIGHAFDELIAWRESAKRPVSGKLENGRSN